MFFLDHIWLIPLFPAIGAACMFFFGRKLSKSAVNGICVGMVVLAFAWACLAVWQYTGYSAAQSRQALREGAVHLAGHRRQHRLSYVDARRPHGRVPRRCRLPARSAVLHLAAVRDRRGHAHPHLLDRLHGARRRLLPLLRLPEPVHVLHADADPGEQLCADVRRLGGRGPVLVPADRLLLPAPLGLDRGEQGIHRQPHR